jgi:antitoxin component HigA of HigAB toxin-antitoxin module
MPNAARKPNEATVSRELKQRVLKGVKAGSESGQVYITLCKAFPLGVIDSKSRHKAALDVISRLIPYMNEHSNGVGHAAKDMRRYLEILSMLVEKYEKERFQTNSPAGEDMLSYLMELHSLKQSDLSKELGTQSVVSEILSGKRRLNVDQIRALSKRFGVSTETFF